MEAQDKSPCMAAKDCLNRSATHPHTDVSASKTLPLRGLRGISKPVFPCSFTREFTLSGRT